MVPRHNHAMKEDVNALPETFHAAIDNELAKLPAKFLANLLQAKVAELGRSLSQEQAESIAEEAIADPENAEAFFEERLGVAVSSEDMAELTKAVEQFCDDTLPDLLRGTLERYSELVLQTLLETWSDQRDLERKARSGFEDRLEDDWGDAFDLLRMLLAFSRELGSSAHSRRDQESLTPVRDEMLVRLHARGCQVASEVMCLIENGFADGAFARWRTLHEIEVTASFIAEGDEALAIRYDDFAHVERKRAADQFQEHHEALGYRPLAAQELQEIDDAYALCLDTHGSDFGRPYGWAAPQLGKKGKYTFEQLEIAIGRNLVRPIYKFATTGIHASRRGLDTPLGLLDRSDAFLAGASNVGFAEPASNTAWSLSLLNRLVLRSEQDLDQAVVLNLCQTLRGRIETAFEKSQEEITARHHTL